MGAGLEPDTVLKDGLGNLKKGLETVSHYAHPTFTVNIPL